MNFGLTIHSSLLQYHRMNEFWPSLGFENYLFHKRDESVQWFISSKYLPSLSSKHLDQPIKFQTFHFPNPLDEKLGSTFGLKGETSNLTCSYDGTRTPTKMEFFTGDASTEGDSWSKVQGDRFSTSQLKQDGNSWKSVLSIAGTCEPLRTNAYSFL